MLIKKSSTLLQLNGCGGVVWVDIAHKQITNV